MINNKQSGMREAEGSEKEWIGVVSVAVLEVYRLLTSRRQLRSTIARYTMPSWPFAAAWRRSASVVLMTDAAST